MPLWSHCLRSNDLCEHREVIHLVLVGAALLFLGYLVLVALDVVVFLFEQSKFGAILALAAVVVVARAIARHFL